ncbi:MAG TPA: alpha/beta family hydrolase [Actinomycetota bacterium]|nr:alpha/beta family hydrolase [Actinomycetota bacterium]
MPVEQLTIETARGEVSAELSGRGRGRPLVVCAPGAGGDMRNAMLLGFAEGLAENGIACLRFNFPYKERGSKAPDPPPVLLDAWRSAFRQAQELGGPVWVSGKSMGGRIGSMAVAEGMPAVGLVFLGYPLHPPGKPERLRDAHLEDVGVPMLFIQGTRDSFARWDLLERVVKRLADRAVLYPIEGGDHSFRVRGKPRDDRGTGRELAGIATPFILEHG